MSEKVYAEYMQAIEGNDIISVKLGRHLLRYFAEFCDNADYNKRLGDEKFKKEENIPDGRGGKVAVWAFKGKQWRLYGAILKVAERRCFVGLSIDPSKKQNKANRQLLVATARMAAEFAEYGA
ncbi:hypothetical protein [Bradyrhizobium sp. USDA 3311]